MSRKKSHYDGDIGFSISEKMKELDEQDVSEESEIPRADQEDEEWVERLYER